MTPKPSNTFCRKVLIFLLSISTGIWCSYSWAESYLESGKQYFNKHRYDEASIEFKNALQENPENAQAHLFLGEVYLKNNQTELALISFNRAGQLDVALLPEATILKLKTYLIRGEHQKILQVEQEKPYSNQHLNAEFKALKGHALLGLNLISDAQAHFQEALDLETKNSNALVGMARIELASNNISQARSYNDAALNADANHIAALLLKGQMEALSGKHSEAIEALSKVISLQHNHMAAKVFRADSYLANKEFELAKADIDAVIKKNKNSPQALYVLAKYYVLVKNYNEAKNAAEAAIRMAPDNSLSYLLAGFANFQIKNFRQARDQLERFVYGQPYHKEATVLLAITYFKLKEPQSIIDLLYPVINDIGDNTPLLAYLLGSAQIQVGDLTEGIKSIEQALASNENHEEFRAMLAIGEIALGNLDNAINELTEAAKKDPSDLTLSLLVATYIRNKDFESADKIIDQYLKNDPGNLTLLRLKALIYENAGDQEKALETFSHMLKTDATFIPAIEGLARISLMQNDTQSAEKLFQDIIKLDKNNLNAYISLANVHFNKKDFSQGVNWLSKARTRIPDSIVPASHLVSYFLTTGELDKALYEARSFYNSKPKEPAASFLLARVYIASNQLPLAQTILEELNNTNPDNLTYGLLLADVLTASANYESAITHLEKMNLKFPSSMEIMVKKADAFIALNKLEKAKSEAIKIRSLKNGYSEAERITGDIETINNNFKQAVLHYQFAFQTNPTPYLTEAIYKSNIHLMRNDLALKAYQDYLQISPQDNLVRINYATALIRQNKFEKAAFEYELIISSEPNNLAALNNLAWLKCQQLGQDCLKYANQALAIAPKNPSILDTAGLAHLEYGDPKKGLNLIQQAVSLRPTSSGLRLNLAIALEKNGLLGDAIKEITRLLRDFDHFPEIDRAKVLQTEWQKKSS